MNGPWTRLARTQWAPLAALAVLTLVTALLAVTVPARIAAGYDAAAGAAAGADGEIRVEAKVPSGEGFRAIPTGVEMSSGSVVWQQALPPSLREAMGAPEPSIALDEGVVSDATDPVPRAVTLSWDFGTQSRIRYVAGAPPENRPSDDSDDDRGRDVQIAVSRAFAARFGYQVGSEVVFKDGLRTRISGLYEAVNPADPYWAPRGKLLRPRTELRGADGVRFEVGAGLIDLGAYAMVVHGPERPLTYSWRLPVARDRIDTGRASTMAADLEVFRTAVKNRTDYFECAVVTSLDGRMHAFAGQLRTAKAVLGLALGGLAAVAAGALLLAAGLLADRLTPVHATMRARGASLRQLAAPACGLTALAVLPAAALGYAAGRLLDAGPPQRTSVYLIAALLALVLALPVVLIVRRQGGATAAPRRDDLAGGRPSRRRLVLEALLVALAVIGVVLLRRRGATSGTDPLITAVPVLLGAALGVVVLRAYPYLLRAAGRALRRGRGAVAFLGVARASRQGLGGAIPLVVLLLAAAVAGFASTVEAALQRGQEHAAWAAVGADARIAAEQFEPGVLGRVRALPGVKAAAQARVVHDLRPPSGPARVTLIALDQEAYEKVSPGRLPAHPKGALLSPAAARDLGSGPVTLGGPGFDPIRITPSGRIRDFPGEEPGTAFAVVPYAALTGTRAFPTEVFVRGDPDPAALRGVLQRSVPKTAITGGLDQVVQSRRDVLRGMTGAPMVDVVHDTFRDGALIGGGYGLLAVLLVVVVGARARGRAVARLRVLGLSGRQSRGLALVEIAPVLVCAAGAGWILGLVLPRVTGPVVDLRPYTGGFAVANHAADPAALPALLGALLLAAAAAVAADRAFDARRRLGGVLRTGD